MNCIIVLIVVDELKEIADDWRELGSYLMSPHIVKEIELQEDSPVKSLESLIIKWRELYPDSNWTDITTALENMGKYELAKHLQRKYLSEVEPVAPDEPISPVKPVALDEPISPVKPDEPVEPVIPVKPVIRAVETDSGGNPSELNGMHHYTTIIITNTQIK